jgi:PKD repeat protein
MKRILLLTFFFAIMFYSGYGQIEEIYTLDNHGRISSVKYPDSLTIYRSFDSVGNIKTVQIINPCFDRPDPKITASGPTTICQGDSVKLSAPQALSYLWSTGSKTQSIWVKTSGSYTVTTIGTLNCIKASAPLTVKVNSLPKPSINANGATSFCPGSSVVLTSTLTGAYLWHNGKTTKSITADSNKIYTLTFTDSNGCKASASKVIILFHKPISSISVNNVTQCDKGHNFSLTNKTTISSGTLKYNWDLGDGTKDTAKNITSKSYSNTGSFAVKLVSTSNNGCKDSASVTLMVNANPVADFTYNTQNQCLTGNSYSLTNKTSIPSGTLNYKWDFGDGTNSTNTNPTKSYSAYGSFNIKLVAISSNNCKDSITKGIVVDPMPSVSFNINSATQCKNENSFDFTNKSTVVSGSLSYFWNSGDSKTYTSKDVTSKIYSNSGSYNAKLVATSDKGCKDSIFKSILVNPNPVITSHSITDVKCKGGSDGKVDVTVSSGTTPYSFLWSNSNTTEDLTNLKAGTYTLVVTDKNSCTIRDTAIVKEPSALKIGHSVIGVKCKGGNNGSVDLTVSGGTANYTFKWSNNSTTEDLSNLTAGTYSVIVTDKNGCTILDSAIVKEPTKLSVSHKIEDVRCYGDKDGSIDITVAGGVKPYKFNWSNNVTSEDISGLIKGSYNVTITDSNACVVKDTAMVNQPLAPLSSSIKTDSVKCFFGNTGSINLIVNGGTLPYYFDWSNKQTTKDISSLSKGKYSVTITDKNGCQLKDSAFINEPLKLMLTKSISNVKCHNGTDGSIDITLSGGIKPYTFNWKSGEKTEDISNKKTGLYKVGLLDNNLCGLNDSFFISQPLAPLSSAISMIPVKCHAGNDGSADLTVNGGTSPYRYEWFDRKGSGISIFQDISNLTVGVYVITILDTNNCVLKDSVKVTQPLAPLFSSTSHNDVKCFGWRDGNADLTITGGTKPYKYKWSNNAVTQDISNLVFGKYNVSVTDSNNCWIKDSVNIGQPTALTSSISSKNVNCFGGNDGSIDLTISGGISPYTYSWSTGSIAQDIANLKSGKYVVTGTDKNSCIIKDSVTILQPIAPLKSILTKIDVNCYGGNDGKTNLIISGGTAPYKFDWSDGSKLQNLYGVTKGFYKVIVSDDNLCQLIDSVTISQPLAPLSLASHVLVDPKCFGASDGSINIYVLGGTAPYSYNWSNFKTTEDLINVEAGHYEIIITDFNSCILSDKYDLIDPERLLTSMGGTTATINANNGTLWVKASGGTPLYNYEWGKPNEFKDTLRNVPIGEYYVLVKDANGCFKSDTFNVLEAPNTSVVQVIPNPTSGHLKVTHLESFGLDLPIKFELFDMTGQLVMIFEVVGKDSYDFILNESLSSGEYNLRISNSRFLENRKLLLLKD